MNFTYFYIITIILLTITGCGTVENDSNSNTVQTDNNNDSASINIEENTSPFEKVQNVYDGESITIGTFISNDLNYYNFTMPKDGNLIADSVYSIYIYDENLNPLYLNPKYPTRDTIKGNLKLKAGKYIIKFNHKNIRRDGDSVPFSLNSNVLYNPNHLPIASKGIHVNKGLQYYLLNMPKDGNLIADSVYSIYIYDENLNPLYLNPKYPTRDTINGNLKLKAGKYIIKFNHRNIRRGGNSVPFSLNSNIFN